MNDSRMKTNHVGLIGNLGLTLAAFAMVPPLEQGPWLSVAFARADTRAPRRAHETPRRACGPSHRGLGARHKGGARRVRRALLATACLALAQTSGARSGTVPSRPARSPRTFAPAEDRTAAKSSGGLVRLGKSDGLVRLGKVAVVGAAVAVMGTQKEASWRRRGQQGGARAPAGRRSGCLVEEIRPSWQDYLAHKECWPQRVLRFESWQSALAAPQEDRPSPGDIVYVPTAVKLPGRLALKVRHCGVVSPRKRNGGNDDGQWSIYDYHGSRWQKNGERQGAFGYSSLQRFADGMDAEGRPAHVRRPVTVLKFASNAQRRKWFADESSFEAHVRPIEETFNGRDHGQYGQFGANQNNCRTAAHTVAHGGWQRFGGLLPVGVPWPSREPRQGSPGPEASY